MNKRSPWYDPNTEKSRLLAALYEVRHHITRSKELLACAKSQRGYILLQLIRATIDDYAECEIGHREFFLDKPHSAGCKHT